MSDMAKQARAAMKAKAKSLTSADPSKKVDSSTWTPPEPLNTTAKTGMRPVSRRAFKSGGKVEGEKAKCNMGRKPRKSGGEATSWVNAKINRNVKDANEEREGKKHIGGMKKGGRAKKEEGGPAIKKIPMGQSGLSPEDKAAWDKKLEAPYTGRPFGSADKVTPQSKTTKELSGHLSFGGDYKKGGRTKRNTGGGTFTKGGKDYRMTPNGPRPLEDEGPAPKQPPIPQRPQREPEKGMTGQEASEFMKARKSGGRAKKAGGGDLEAYGKGVSGAADMMKKASARAGVPGGLYGSGFTRVGAGKLSPAGAAMPMTRMKKGGKAEAKEESYNALRAKGGTQVMGSYKKGGEAKHPDEAMDRALFKKMEKAEAKKERREDEKADKALIKKMVKPEARTGRASGGRTKTKGKTNINIVIAAGKPAGQGDMMPPGGPTLPPGMGAAPGGLPIPVPAAGGAAGGAPMPMPMPMPMPAPAPAAGPAPTPRRDGGRLTKRAASYKDMEAGAGSGEGRLQKTDIAKRIPKPTENGVIGTTNLGYPNKVPGATGGRTARKAGGKAYRSYKDMDAGAGSGMGRLEKTEIQARKG